MKLGDKIRQLREARGISSQEELARLAGVSLWTVHRIEANKTVPRETTLARIAEALGVDASFFDLWARDDKATNRINRNRKMRSGVIA